VDADVIGERVSSAIPASRMAWKKLSRLRVMAARS
jgi:hypothetical protein